MTKSWVLELPFAYLASDVPMAGSRRRGEAWIRSTLPMRFAATDEKSFPAAMTATDSFGGRVDYRTDGTLLFAPIAHPVINRAAREGGYLAPPQGLEQVTTAIDDGLVHPGVSDWTGLSGAAAAAAKAAKQNKPWEAREGASDPVARAAAEEKLRSAASKLLVFDNMLWQAATPPQWSIGTDPDNDKHFAPFLYLPSQGGTVSPVAHRLLPYRSEEAGCDDLESALIACEFLNGQRPRAYGEAVIHDGFPRPTMEQLAVYVSIREAMLVGMTNKLLEDSHTCRAVGRMERGDMLAWANLRDAANAINGLTETSLNGRFWIPRDGNDDRAVAMRGISQSNPHLIPDLVQTISAFAPPIRAGLQTQLNEGYRELTELLRAAAMAQGSRSYAAAMAPQAEVNTLSR